MNLTEKSGSGVETKTVKSGEKYYLDLVVDAYYNCNYFYAER